MSQLTNATVLLSHCVIMFPCVTLQGHPGIPGYPGLDGVEGMKVASHMKILDFNLLGISQCGQSDIWKLSGKWLDGSLL